LRQLFGLAFVAVGLVLCILFFVRSGEEKLPPRVATVESGPVTPGPGRLADKSPVPIEPSQSRIMEKDTRSAIAAVEAPKQHLGEIKGRVLNLRDEAIEGCKVVLLKGEEAGKAVQDFARRGQYPLHESYATTGSDGAFLFSAVPEGTFTLSFRASGYVCRLSEQPIEVLAGESTGPIIQRLEEAESIRGEVVENLTGKPVEGAKISADLASMNRVETDSVWSGPIAAFSDAQGEFSLDVLPPLEQYHLTCEHQDYFQIEQKDVPTNGEAVRFVLSSRGSVSGRVILGPDGPPVEGAEVTAYIHGYWQKTVTSASDGSFTLKGLEPKTYRFKARSGDLATELRPEYERDIRAYSTNAPLELILVSGGGVEIEILDEANRRPISGAEVQLRPLAKSRFFWTRETGIHHTNEQGLVRIEGLEAVDLAFRVFASGYLPQRLTLKDPLLARPGTTVKRTVLLSASRVLSGRVVDWQDRAVPDAKVLAFLQDDSQSNMFRHREAHAETMTFPDGTFQIGGLSEGIFDLRAEKEAWAPAELESVSAGTQDILLAFPKGAELSGWVRDSVGRPVAAAEVRLLSRRPTRYRRPEHSTQTDAAGRWAFERLENSSYRIQAFHDKGCSLVQTLDLREGEVRSGVELILYDRVRVSGRVVDKVSRTGLEGIELEYRVNGPFLVVFRGGRLPLPRTQTDADGSFSFEKVFPGKYLLVSHQPPEPYFIDDFPFEVQDAPVSDLIVEAIAGATIRGHVFKPSGEAAAGADVLIKSGYVMQRTTSDESGIYRIASLPPAKNYRLMIRMPGVGSIETEEFALEQGQILEDFDLHLQAFGKILATIQDAQGNRVTEGYGVRVLQRDNIFGPFMLRAIEPSEGGYYEIEDVSAGDVKIQLVGGNGKPLETREIQIDPGQTRVVTLTCP